MKNVRLFFIAVMLMRVVSFAQGLPADPASQPRVAVPYQADSSSNPLPPPSPKPDSFWLRVQQIANGEQIEVTSTYGPPLNCRFAGATDAWLFCDPPGTPADTGYGFERASVLDVRVLKPQRNWPRGLFSAMIAGGLVVGIAASRQTDAGHATEAGLLGAAVAGAVASPFVFLPAPSPGTIGMSLTVHPRVIVPRRHRIPARLR